MSANILSPDERRELTTIPLDISDAELVRHFSLTPTDLAIIDHRLRPAHQLDQAAHQNSRVVAPRFSGGAETRAARSARSA